MHGVFYAINIVLIIYLYYIFGAYYLRRGFVERTMHPMAALFGAFAMPVAPLMAIGALEEKMEEHSVGLVITITLIIAFIYFSRTEAFAKIFSKKEKVDVNVIWRRYKRIKADLERYEKELEHNPYDDQRKRVEEQIVEVKKTMAVYAEYFADWNEYEDAVKQSKEVIKLRGNRGYQAFVAENQDRLTPPTPPFHLNGD